MYILLFLTSFLLASKPVCQDYCGCPNTSTSTTSCVSATDGDTFTCGYFCEHS